MKYCFFTFLLSAMLFACSQKQLSIEEPLDTAEEQFNRLLVSVEDMGFLPRSADKQNEFWWIKKQQIEWTKGFFPGTCWLFYDYSKDPKWKEAAIKWQNSFKDNRLETNTHDLGFVFNCSYGQGYKITRAPEMKEVLVVAANSLMSRFDSTIGCIRSWSGWGNWQFPVIIDNMMNLELLFNVTHLTGDSTYYKAAVSHANTTMKNHFRNDYSSYHVVDYCPTTGKVIKKTTHQGFSDESCWARGQSWGLYGFTMCYRYTRNKKYLDFAEKIAEYNIAQWPDDYIPVWDYKSPDSLSQHRDASAAAVFASGLIELSQYTQNEYYIKVAEKILMTLSSDNYRAKEGEYGNFILKNSVGDLWNRKEQTYNDVKEGEIDHAINYADYYYIEALLKYQKAINK